ncbi:Polynucleotidyl transferase, Ribonuclease H fold [Sesbania bispinosa]|nr:Polynucleotidyl transferase, Ribonuclease H fold [Sesbania bispinosa]
MAALLVNLEGQDLEDFLEIKRLGTKDTGTIAVSKILHMPHPLSSSHYQGDSRLHGQRMGGELIHTLRESNACADHLVKRGAQQDEKLVILTNRPQDMNLTILWDATGVRFRRE